MHLLWKCTTQSYVCMQIGVFYIMHIMNDYWRGGGGGVSDLGTVSTMT